MRGIAVLLLCAALMLGAAALVSADASLSGPTGLVFAPTADVLPLGGGDTYYSSIDKDGETTSFYGASIGFGGGLEVGYQKAHSPVEGGSSKTHTQVSAKWSFMKESLVLPGIALGGLNLTREDGKVVPFGAITKKFEVPGMQAGLLLNAAYLAGDQKSWTVGVGASLSSVLSISIEKPDNQKAIYGVRLKPTPTMSLQAFDQDGNVGFGASFGIGLTR